MKIFDYYIDCHVSQIQDIEEHLSTFCTAHIKRKQIDVDTAYLTISDSNWNSYESFLKVLIDNAPTPYKVSKIKGFSLYHYEE